jgi:hypothetical protein
MGMAITVEPLDFNPSLSDMACATFNFSGEIEICNLQTQYWSLNDYYGQWVEALNRVIDQLLPAAMITSIVDSDAAANVVAWILFPLTDGNVAIQQRILLSDKFIGPLGVIDYDMLRQRETIDEDGNPVSEWSVKIEDLISVRDSMRNQV